tara:strand:+ start:4929 stop:5906 length:978 start_codon:yes stop_codon:yes gene_type:complete
MLDLPIRPRRNRKSQWLKDLLAQNNIVASDLILPIFITEGDNQKVAIENFPDQFRFSIDLAVSQAQKAAEVGIKAVILFPSIEQSLKSADGKEAVNPDNLICRAVKAIKAQVPNIGVICDVALDPYSDHGHDGVLDQDGDVDNDKTVSILKQQALIQAQAGCDIVAPSDMMDGRIQEIRKTLDQNGFVNVGIISYCAKYASNFYGPFRSILGSDKNLQAADKKTYQMDYRNSTEAIRQAILDQEQGADMLIVKPAMPYLDIIKEMSQTVQIPIIAYQVSGEYAMIKYAAQNGAINYDEAVLESLIACKRAGATAIISYFALEYLQ